ncbi:MAG: (2Fe-2S)-binding protein [Planctomycetota bacterium]
MTGERLRGAPERAEVVFTFAGQRIAAREGDSIAMALWAAGERVLRQSSRDGAPRGVLCNMGICYECLCVVDGVTVRACTTLVRPGVRVERGGRP